MTSPSCISLWFLVVIGYAVIASTIFANLIASRLINNICHQTTFFDFCREAFITNPTSASPNADLYILGMVTSNFISDNVTSSTAKIEGMLSSEQSARRRHSLHTCFQAYKALWDYMSRFSIHWGNRKFTDAKAQATMGINKVAECKAAFRKGESPFESNNKTVKRLFTMAIVMCDMATR